MLATLVMAGTAAQGQTNTSTNATNSATTSKTNTVPAHIKVPPPPPTYPWKSSISLGVTIARGNTDNTLASISAATEKKWPMNDLAFGADGLYGETKNPGQQQYTESAEVLHGFSQYDRTLGHDWYAYGRVDGFHDGIADIKYRLSVSLGLGYFFVTNKTWDWSAQAGPGYVKQQLDGDSQSFASLRLSETLHYNISPNAKAWETVVFLPQVDRFDNYLVNAELGVEASLNKAKNLSLRSVLDDSYVNVPAAGRLKNDLRLITSLVYKF